MVTADLDVTKAGTPAAPQPVTATFSGLADGPLPPAGATGSPATGFSLHLGSGFQAGAAGLPGCPEDAVLSDETGCPSESRIGSGSIELSFVGMPEPVSLKLFNGVGGDTITVLAVGETPLIIREAFTGLRSQDGTTFTFTFPAGMQAPAPGAFTHLHSISFSVGSNSAGGSWLRTTGCPGGALTATLAVTAGAFGNYADDTTIPCSPTPAEPTPPDTGGTVVPASSDGCRDGCPKPAVSRAGVPAIARSARLAQGRLRLSLACPAASTGCRGTLDVLAPPRIAARARGRRVLGHAVFTITPGTTQTVSVKLGRRAPGRNVTKLAVRISAGAGAKPTVATVKLRRTR